MYSIDIANVNVKRERYREKVAKQRGNGNIPSAREPQMSRKIIAAG